MNDWIEAKDKLPKPYETVLVMQSNGKQAFAFRALKREKLKLELFEVYKGSAVKWKYLDEE